MRKPDTILDEVHAIRRKIEDETKGMTATEITAYYNRAGEAAAKKYGFRRIASIQEDSVPQKV